MPYPNIDDVVISNRILDFDDWYNALIDRKIYDIEGNIDYVLKVKFENCIIMFEHETYLAPITVMKNMYVGHFEEPHICISKCIFMSIDKKTGVETPFTLEDILKEK